jgi:hypothetical protein
VIAESFGCGAVLTDDEQSAQANLGVGEHVYRVRRGDLQPVATGLPKTGGHMAREGTKRNGGGLPLWVGPGRRFRGRCRALDPTRLSPTDRPRPAFGRGTTCPRLRAIRHCAAVSRARRLPFVTNAGGDARRSSFLRPSTCRRIALLASAFLAHTPAGVLAPVWALATGKQSGSIGSDMKGTFSGTDFASGGSVSGTFSCNG